MPVLVLTISEDLDELLQYRRLTAIAALCKFGRIMVVAVYTALMLVVAVGGAEHGGTYGASEMLDVVFAVEGSDV